MKPRDHYRYTLHACLAAAPQPRRGDCRRIAEAAMEPDAQPDYRVVCRVVGRRRRRIVCRRRKVRHHEREGLETGVEYLVEARKLYMRGDDGYVRPLGRGIHYVQDHMVYRYRLLFDKRDHDEREALLSKARPEEIGVEGLPEAPIPRRLYRLLKRPPYPRAERLPRAVYRVTVYLLRAFYTPSAPVFENYGLRALIHWSGALAAGLATAAAIITLLGAAFWPLGLFAGLAGAALVDTLDEHYYALAFEKKWLGR